MGIATLLKQIDTKATELYEVTNADLLKIQFMLKEMLQDVAEFCEENGISWCLFGGSALGCIRDSGFIPWDDDIDIFMLRGDYNRFKKIFPGKLSTKYILKEPGDEGYLMDFPQIQKKGTKLKLIQSDNNTEDGITIDIFLMEDTYDNRLKRDLHGLECTVYMFIDSVLRTERCKDNLIKYGSQNPKLMREVKRRLFFARFFHFRSLEEWLRRSDACFSKVKNPRSKFIVAPSGVKHYWGELYDREKMCDCKKTKFSGKDFYIMKDYNYYLKKRYGANYMIPPDEKDRERHVFVEFDLGDK